MLTEDSKQGYSERLETLIELAKSGIKGQVEVDLRKEIIKQVGYTEETDDLKVEKDLYLLMGSFTMVDDEGKRRDVTKVYAFGNINNTEFEEKAIRNIANERLKMDYHRLQDIKIDCQEKFF